MLRRLVPLVLVLAAGCSSGLNLTQPSCDAARQLGCAAGQYCEAVPGYGAACFAPVLVSGDVVDATGVTTVYVNDARVVALDANRAPASSVGVTSGLGAYQLAVHAPRDLSGRPLSTKITLRADAQGYQPFPGGVRPALPIDLSTAQAASGRWVVRGALTALELLPLAEAGAGRIQGTVARVAGVPAALVVAEPSDGGPAVTAVADVDGSYELFNLDPALTYVVTPYAQGANYARSIATTPGSPTPVTVSFALPGSTAAAVSGELIYNNGASSNIDVTLVVESTYVSTLDRGETPPGLTVHANGSGYSFAEVPDGSYRVLAAFGIDGDVRDQSSTGNAIPPTVVVSGGANATPSASFKIVPSVDLQTIGGVAVGVDPITVVTSATPAFGWRRGSVDASAHTYRVLVLDAFGTLVWSSDQAVTADDGVTYAGTALEPGRPYQLRILAISEAMPVPATFEQLSQTEDLLGVFTYLP